MNNVFINKISKYLPNDPVNNDRMELLLGKVNEIASKSRRLVLRNNGIENRYYAIDENQQATHSNAELTTLAIEEIFKSGFEEKDLEVLSCGTSTPDQIVPSHAAMVHGMLGKRSLELNSSSGVCCSGMNALKYGYLSVRSGNSINAICTGSERVSTFLKSTHFKKEIDKRKELEENPMIAFEKDFLRWMLSDGATALLLENEAKGDISLKIEWMESFSYAHELETCMYAGAIKNEDGSLTSWGELSPAENMDKSVLSLKQDIKVLNENILEKGVKSLKEALDKHQLEPNQLDFFLPHLSSYYFKEKLHDLMLEKGVNIDMDKWFTNLKNVGNVGSASGFLMLEELMNNGKLSKGQNILLSIPESARFSYAYALLKVV